MKSEKCVTENPHHSIWAIHYATTPLAPLVRGSRLLRLRLRKKNGVCDYKTVWSCLMVHPVRNSAWSLRVFPAHRTFK